jgi:hypothetical protein
MSPARFHRFNLRSTDIICLGTALLAVLMWLAAVADQVLGLRWGWDVEIVWIAPIIVGGALLIRTERSSVGSTQSTNVRFPPVADIHEPIPRR